MRPLKWPFSVSRSSAPAADPPVPGCGYGYGSALRRVRPSIRSSLSPRNSDRRNFVGFLHTCAPGGWRFSLDVANHLGYRVFRRDGDHHVNVAGHQMPRFNPAFLLLCQSAKYLTQISTPPLIMHFPSTSGDERDVVFAFPILYGLGSQTRPLMELHTCAVAAHVPELHRWTTRGMPLQMSSFCCLPGKVGRTRFLV